MELLCVPGAGGSPRAFRPWAGALAPDITVRPLNPRGRDTPASSLVGVAARLVERIPRDGRYALAGHSMGGLIAYEMARLVCAGDTLPRPEFVVVAGARPPHSSPAGEFARLVAVADDDEFLGELAAAGLVEPAARHSPMRALFVPTLRADLRLVAEYRPEPGDPLPVDLLAWHGADDPSASPAAVGDWARYTAAGFHPAAFPGGHHFPFERPAEVAARLRAHVSVP
ncbi:alpha/beta fold hydrolase [Amycolatopsis sp. NBC_00355]|uniref:thioesterase II family protein n=1 Tax=Amycolatopsis sp. NBC_00355 TaxID=2975957 RepID=UPI002E263F65